MKTQEERRQLAIRDAYKKLPDPYKYPVGYKMRFEYIDEEFPPMAAWAKMENGAVPPLQEIKCGTITFEVRNTSLRNWYLVDGDKDGIQKHH